MTKKTNQTKLRRQQKIKASAYRYETLSPFRAFKAIVCQSKRMSLTTFLYSDGLATYSLCVSEGTCRLECLVATVPIYSHIYNLGSLRPEYADQLDALRRIHVGQTARPVSDMQFGRTSSTGINVRRGNETSSNRAAIENFRQSTRAQVHVRSRKPVDDMMFGRTPGHIGDLK